MTSLDTFHSRSTLDVDGRSYEIFRLDAVPYLTEREGTNCENLPDTHAVVAGIRNTLALADLEPLKNISRRMLERLACQPAPAQG